MRIKTHPITAILTSAYLSAMLTSSLAPIRNNTIFAAAVDPAAAEKALQNAVSGLDAAGWAIAATPAPGQTAPTPVPVKVTPKTDPVMTQELMARLIKLTQEQTKLGSISAPVCAVFNLCDGTAKLPTRGIETEEPAGTHFMIPATPGSTDILIVEEMKDGSLEAYLTDNTFTLRAAAIAVTTKTYLITNEKAAAKFKAALSHLAREASALPPTGTAVTGNS